MLDLTQAENQIQYVTSFQDLVTCPFNGENNAICWVRNLIGDFSEIVRKVKLKENITVLELKELSKLQLSEQGNLAREIIINDFKLLEAHGASPTLNLIKCYQRDDAYPLFPTDVYSFHIDRSPIPVDTFLCTYHGDSSEIVPNSQAIQKIIIPEIRDGLKKLYQGPDEGFEAFLSEHFFDLHYQAKHEANLISCGIGKLWRLAVDHPESKVLPCLHRAPNEDKGQVRLLMIC